ncbi:hypothetical protein HF524_14165 [Proteus mirabilis]|nr:hypothetical protein [Proteus mirabilis]MDC5890832.1 hypothetical protein [Proteus mirabilis]MDC5911969.1 hypothetical protein [Proteus mirabilis]MDC6003918.1 hypothetical protein [Proteus mirabilis]MDF7191528.1 hypothetical protein [Proteus mirabilis]MDF7241974.1 hypothetical protein [Proteus mirabilis]
MYEVQVFAYGQHYNFIFVEASDKETANEQVNALNAIDGDLSFLLTGNSK